MVRQALIVMCSLFILNAPLALVGCGGGATGPDAPGNDEGGPEGTPATDPKPSDGIVRDADGDGVPDEEGGSDCDGKTQTQCQINMACAWSDDGKCVKATSSPM